MTGEMSSRNTRYLQYSYWFSALRTAVEGNRTTTQRSVLVHHMQLRQIVGSILSSMGELSPSLSREKN